MAPHHRGYLPDILTAAGLWPAVAAPPLNETLYPTPWDAGGQEPAHAF